MDIWLVLLIALLFGFSVGRFFVVPLGALGWLGWMYYDDHRHPERPRLEENLGVEVAIILTVAVGIAILTGVILRWAVRSVMAGRNAPL